MLKNDFNKIHSVNQSADEVPLLKALIKALDKTGYAYPEEKHGIIGQVKHNMIISADSPKDRQCEIADILIIFIRGNEMRYTFMQNKRDKKHKYSKSSPIKRVMANPVQWDLLHYRCMLSNSLSTRLPLDYLNSAVLPSAASYGIFVNDSHSTNVDMTYVIAKDLIPKSSNIIGYPHPNPRSYKILTNYLKINKKKGYDEVDGTITLDEFELLGKLMKIGSPINPYCKNQANLFKYIVSCIQRCLKKKPNDIYQKIVSDFVRNVTNKNFIPSTDEQIKYMPFNLVVIEGVDRAIYLTEGNRLSIEYIKSILGDKVQVMNVNQVLKIDSEILIIDSSICQDINEVREKYNFRGQFIYKLTHTENQLVIEGI